MVRVVLGGSTVHPYYRATCCHGHGCGVGKPRGLMQRFGQNYPLMMSAPGCTPRGCGLKGVQPPVAGPSASHQPAIYRGTSPAEDAHRGHLHRVNGRGFLRRGGVSRRDRITKGWCFTAVNRGLGAATFALRHLSVSRLSSLMAGDSTSVNHLPPAHEDRLSEQVTDRVEATVGFTQ